MDEKLGSRVFAPLSLLPLVQFPRIVMYTHSTVTCAVRIVTVGLS